MAKTVYQMLVDTQLDIEKKEEQLRNIMRNTMHHDFGNDIVFKSCLLGSIRIALGDEEYKRLEELYS